MSRTPPPSADPDRSAVVAGAPRFATRTLAADPPAADDIRGRWPRP